MLRRVLFALALVTLASPSVHASPVFGLEGFASFSQYALDDIDRSLTLANQLDGAAFESIPAQFSGGGGIRLWATPNWLVSASAEPMLGRSENAAAAGEELSVRGNGFQFTGAWTTGAGRAWRAGFGAGVGLYSLDGEISTADGRQRLRGTNAGWHIVGVGEWSVNPRLGLTATAGWRGAEVEIDGSSNGSTVDYSGPTGRLGVALYLPSR